MKADASLFCSLLPAYSWYQTWHLALALECSGERILVGAGGLAFSELTCGYFIVLQPLLGRPAGGSTWGSRLEGVYGNQPPTLQELSSTALWG